MTSSLPTTGAVFHADVTRKELAVAFCLPLLALVEFGLIGRMHLAEAVMLLGLPFLLFRYWQRAGDGWRLSRQAWMTLVFGLLWFGSLILSDLYRGTSFQDFSRGWAKTGFFLGLFLFLNLYLKDQPWKIALFALGLAVVTPIKPFLYQSAAEVMEYGEQALWKFRVAAPLTALAALAFCHPRLRGRFKLGAMTLAGIGVLNMLMGSRSSALMALLVAAALFVAGDYERARSQGRPWSGISLLLTGVVACGLILGLYRFALDHTLIETDLQERHEKQSASKLGLLIGGRSEALYALTAIGDSPFIGYGSWAKSPKYAHLDLSEYGIEDARRFDEGTEKEDLIPTHSHILGGWVEAGLLGGVFWIRILWLAVAALLIGLRRNDPIWPLTACTGIGLIWSLPFSPFGFEGRLIKAFEAVIMLYALGRARKVVPAPEAARTNERPSSLPWLKPAWAGIHSITRRLS